MSESVPVTVHPEGAPFYAHAADLSCPYCEVYGISTPSTSASPSAVVPTGLYLPAPSGAEGVFPLDPGAPRAQHASSRTRLTLIACLVGPLFLLSGCATLAPGADPVVVRTEQVLQAAPAVYDAGMTWCEGHVAQLSPASLKVANDVRVAFPHAYRAADSALQLYKAGKGGDPLGQLAELERLTRELMTLVKLAGGPDLTPPGGKQP